MQLSVSARGAAQPRLRALNLRLRPFLLVGVVILTLAAAPALSAFAAGNYQAQATATLEGQAQRAHTDFEAQVSRSLAEGTPKDLLARVVSDEAKLSATPFPHTGLWLDRLVLTSLRHRVDALNGLTAAVVAVETQTEVDLHQQVGDALAGLRTDIQAAQQVNLDTTAYEAFATELDGKSKSLSTPLAQRAQLASIGAQDQKLKQATSAEVAAVNAFKAAKDGAAYQLKRAQYWLAQAKAIPVLKVQPYDTAIAGLGTQVTAATTTAQFQDVATQLRIQADQLSQMIGVRSTAYGLRDLARQHLQKAVDAHLDVTNETQLLAAAGVALDAAGDLPGLSSARDQVQAAKNAIDIKYNLAVYGPGKVIVVSLDRQEMQVLQDGLVVLDSLVTTGRPALPTPPGSYSIMQKYSPYTMRSPWPKSSPYYYNTSTVQWAMLFLNDGYFIHDAPWRTHYGPGSDSEFGGTHGCINVPHNQMSWLWDWTSIGTKVVVVSGDF